MYLYFFVCLFLLALTFNKVVVTLSVLKELKKQTIEVKELVENHSTEEAFVNDEPQSAEEYVESMFGFVDDNDRYI